MQIFCFGDSTAHGKNSSWVKDLRSLVEGKGDRKSVYNLGVKEDSSRELLQRFEDELEARKRDGECIIIFQVGLNDSQVIKTKNGNRVQIEEFGQNLDKLWQKARQHTDKIIFTGLTPVIDSETDPLEWNRNKAYRTQHVRKYEDKLYEFCTEKDILFVELYDLFLENGYGELLVDGFHPNKEGNHLIFERIKEKLREEAMVPSIRF